jgi:hypothetical protein
MDIILYRYLLRRLMLFPITFSRNKNFNSYDSNEGTNAIRRAKVLREIISEINKNDNKVEIKKQDKSYNIVINDDILHVKTEYIINGFEKEIIKEKLLDTNFMIFDG